MGDDIGLGEVGAGRAQFGLHLAPEAEVEVNLLIGGAVEGAHGRLALAAAGLGALLIQHGGRRGVAAQLGLPHVVDVGADDLDELAGLILGRARLAGLFGLTGAAELAGDLLGGAGVDAEDEIADGRQHQNADAAARHGAAAHAAPVLDAAAAPSALPTHDVVSALKSRPKLGPNAGAGEGMQLRRSRSRRAPSARGPEPRAPDAPVPACAGRRRWAVAGAGRAGARPEAAGSSAGFAAAVAGPGLRARRPDCAGGPSRSGAGRRWPSRDQLPRHHRVGSPLSQVSGSEPELGNGRGRHQAQRPGDASPGRTGVEDGGGLRPRRDGGLGPAPGHLRLAGGPVRGHRRRHRLQQPRRGRRGAGGPVHPGRPGRCAADRAVSGRGAPRLARAGRPHGAAGGFAAGHPDHQRHCPAAADRGRGGLLSLGRAFLDRRPARRGHPGRKHEGRGAAGRPADRPGSGRARLSRRRRSDRRRANLYSWPGNGRAAPRAPASARRPGRHGRLAACGPRRDHARRPDQARACDPGPRRQGPDRARSERSRRRRFVGRPVGHADGHDSPRRLHDRRRQTPGHDLEKGHSPDARASGVLGSHHVRRPVDEGPVGNPDRARRTVAEGGLRRHPALQRRPRRNASGGRGNGQAEERGQTPRRGGSQPHRPHARTAGCGRGPRPAGGGFDWPLRGGQGARRGAAARPAGAGPHAEGGPAPAVDHQAGRPVSGLRSRGAAAQLRHGRRLSGDGGMAGLSQVAPAAAAHREGQGRGAAGGRNGRRPGVSPAEA
uniref:LigA n=1 Tax=Parastrongyloides trichosuri TaxID=131310 RepID=A0A0N4ZVR0_PARTI